MKNEELVKALRCCIVDFNSTQSRLCNECPYRIYADGKKACENKAKRDAADILKQTDAVKHGEWIKHGIGHENVPWGFDCSICKEWFVIDSKFIGRYKYCPNCGAKMDVTQSNDSNVLDALDGKEKDGE